MIPFKMMYNMSMLRHRFSNERWGGGGGRNELPSSPRRIRIVSHNASDKVILPRLFQIWRHFQVATV